MFGFGKSGQSKAPKTVFNIERKSMQSLTAIRGHENRTMGDLTHVDHSRTHLNEVEGYGGETCPKKAALKYFQDKNIKVDKRNTTPLTSLVVGVSKGYFGQSEGQDCSFADPEKLEAWKKATMKWVKDNMGADAVHTSVHLDETTPHMHILMVPTYEKKTKRRTVQQASHHNHEFFKGRNSYSKVLDSYAEALAHLGIERGEKPLEGAEKPSHKTKQQELNDRLRKTKNEAKRIAALDRREEKISKRDKDQLARDKALSAKEDELDSREAELDSRDKELIEEAKAVRADAKRASTPVSLKTVETSEREPSKPKRQEKRARRKPKVVVDVR